MLLQRKRAAGHDRVVAVGLSMGGTSVLHAAAQGAPADAVVAISTPAELGAVETDAMAGLDDLWRTPWKRIGFRLVSGVRLIAPEDPEHVLITSFFYPELKNPENTSLVPPIIRPAVQRLTPTRGEPSNHAGSKWYPARSRSAAWSSPAPCPAKSAAPCCPA